MMNDLIKKKIKAGMHPIGIRNMGAEAIKLVEDLTPNCKGEVAERAYWIKSDLTDYPKCKLCEIPLSSKSFLNGQRGYRAFCSRSCSSTANQEQISATSLIKYGVSHPLKLKSVQEKRAATNLERYGDTNPIRWSSDKFKNKMLEIYGAPSILQSDQKSDMILRINRVKRDNYLLRAQNFINDASIRGLTLVSSLDQYFDQDSKLSWKCKCGHVSLRPLTSPKCESCHPKSKPESEILFFVKSLTEVIQGDRTVIAPQELDIYAPKANLAIEVDGCYWHSSKFIEKSYHLDKTNLAASKGIKLLHFWDHEVNQKKNAVEGIIKSHLGINIKLHGRQCIVKEITPADSKTFLEANHLQGATQAGLSLGLFYENELVSVMTFSIPRFNKNFDWELARFCSKNGVTVRGGASKLLTEFLKIENPKSLISYADRRYSTGGLYEALGMKLIRKNSPGYFYYHKSGKIYSRYQAQKHKLGELLKKTVDLSMTEEDIMNSNEFYRVYDCGQLVYSLVS